MEARRWQTVTEWARWLMSVEMLIHKPSRLAILTVLREQGKVRYRDIIECTGLSKSSLSKDLARLERAGLVAVEKHFEAKTPVTTAVLTENGERSVAAYWMSMKTIADGLPFVGNSLQQNPEVSADNDWLSEAGGTDKTNQGCMNEPAEEGL